MSAMEEQLSMLAAEIAGRLFIEVEASGRHVHVTEQQAVALFGQRLTPLRPLSQPGQFVSGQRVEIIGPKGKLSNVAVLGPERKEGQVEISLTDAVALGVSPPIRLSGKTEGSPGILLRGPKGEIFLDHGGIVAPRDMHLPPQEAQLRGLKDRQIVQVKLFTSRSLVFDDVVVRVDPSFAPRVHIDFDEANACGFKKGDYGMIIHG